MNYLARCCCFISRFFRTPRPAVLGAERPTPLMAESFPQRSHSQGRPSLAASAGRPLTAARAKGTSRATPEGSTANGSRLLAPANGFFLLFHFAARSSWPKTLFSHTGEVCVVFTNSPANESCHEPVPSPVRCVVIHKEIVSVPSGFRQTSHGFLVRLWNRA